MNGAASGTTDALRQLLGQLANLAPAADDADRIDRIRFFEEAKAALAAAQMAEAVAFAASQRAVQAGRGVPADRQDRGIASQVALARRISPWAAQRWLGNARILTTELPATFAQLRAGRTTEWRAMLVARETAVLSREGRATADAELAPRLEGLGDRAVEARARPIAYRLDPAAAVRRASNAANDRVVTMRPAPDSMARLTVLTTVQACVAAYAALSSSADSLIGTGQQGCNADGALRGRGQVMADTMIERLTGKAAADDVDVEISLVMTDATLRGDLGAGDEPGVVLGYGPIPAGLARDLAHGRPGHRGRRSLRRAFANRDGTRLITMETTRREFTDHQRAFLRLRDQTCRTPWCNAPIRHTDHVTPFADGGPTHIDNGQSLCQTCNHAKQAPGWTAAATTDGTVTTRTSTGHTYNSRAPAPPGAGRPLEVETRLSTAAVA